MSGRGLLVAVALIDKINTLLISILIIEQLFFYKHDANHRMLILKKLDTHFAAKSALPAMGMS